MEKAKVMVNGLPGNMATVVARYLLWQNDITVLPQSLTGPEIDMISFQVTDKDSFFLFQQGKHVEIFPRIVSAHAPFIAVDFTSPAAVVLNARLYCEHKVPFVMGTTGGDRDLLADMVAKAGICAIIAPNMSKEIVGFTAMMQHMAINFSKIFAGYTLRITESHQAGKADTSGTARAMIGFFNAMGIVPFEEKQIKKIRDPKTQEVMGVPKQNLGGHGWHTYELVSPDGNVMFCFTHNVNGRGVYAEGVAAAVRFLAKKVGEGVNGQVFSMIDVLKGV
ncbi:MAG: dihydrodipicolinate reductase C-terminal domain-containing protein [Patescibacteria group bacterium]|nr:dihydrodipicolinate reductase C-terminal domain-containing protein [Patescibacteria group bacterium]MDD4610770.1 dihydrodipicolinate reductase C-terminal domain-containing protein [Patescibacteria group bacterium]